MTQQQHISIERKLGLRKRLLSTLKQPGDAYVPFIGDGDIAVALYGDRDIWGVDNDYDRIMTANRQLSNISRVGKNRYHSLAVGDADQWQFGTGRHQWSGLHGFAVADFDAYSYPYDSFRAFWTEAPKAPKVSLFFTGAQRQTMLLNGTYKHPDGVEITIPASEVQGRAKAMRFYFQKTCPAWLKEYIKPWRVTSTAFYNRSNMLYWGANVSKVRT